MIVFEKGNECIVSGGVDGGEVLSLMVRMAGTVLSTAAGCAAGSLSGPVGLIVGCGVGATGGVAIAAMSVTEYLSNQ